MKGRASVTVKMFRKTTQTFAPLQGARLPSVNFEWRKLLCSFFQILVFMDGASYFGDFKGTWEGRNFQRAVLGFVDNQQVCPYNDGLVRIAGGV